MTRFPNQLAQTQNEAYNKLSKYIPLSYYGCSKHLMPFVCSLYVPPCNSSGTGYLSPCKSLCEVAKRGCESVMNKFGYKWEGELSCDNFDDGDGCFSNGAKSKLLYLSP